MEKVISIIFNSSYTKFVLMISIILLLANIAFDLGGYVGKFLFVLLH